MGVGFLRDAIGAGLCGRAAAGEARQREIEASPEEMDGAALADEEGAEIVEDIATGRENAPEFVDGFAVVGGVSSILVEGIGSGISTGIFQIFVSIPCERSMAKNSP